jgi:hypothetical protein
MTGGEGEKMASAEIVSLVRVDSGRSKSPRTERHAYERSKGKKVDSILEMVGDHHHALLGDKEGRLMYMHAS